MHWLRSRIILCRFQKLQSFALSRSAGVGLRVFMPAFGLLGIDFGHGFDALPGTTKPNGWETHFIIGQQFQYDKIFKYIKL
jgi:outer membrane protein insertion porin family